MGISQLDIMLVYRRATTSVDMRAASVGALKALTQIITGSPAGKGSLEGSPFCLARQPTILLLAPPPARFHAVCHILCSLNLIVKRIQNADTETACNRLRCSAQRVWDEAHAAQEPRYSFPSCVQSLAKPCSSLS